MLSHAQTRFNNYHTPKQRILGNPSARPAPAWRPNAKAASGSNAETGSKILLSRLPLDVVENEVEVLFSRTVGAVRDVFMVYNSQGKSKGMAVVTFARPGDAAVARAKYNGKIVDGRRPIKIEIIVDEDDARKPAPPLPATPSLLDRLSPQRAPAQGPAQSNAKPTIPQGKNAALNAAPPPAAPAHNPKVRLRSKKGPRRLNKQRQQGQVAQQPRQPPKKKTAEDLDREMEEYKARAEGGKNIRQSESSTMDVA
ncbi:hypothetical protein C8Q79DRAFT_1002966 [Trametes meyenii]|nr:hypothetical protein C8Q79DRAFT_1002966 [Trametes meyenii]